MLVRMALCHVRFGTFGQHATQLLALHEAQSSLQGHVQLLGSGIDQDTGVALARIIHERFCCNHGFAAADKPGRGGHGVQTGGLAVRSVDVLFQVCLPPSRLRAPVSLGDCAISPRTVMNNAG